MKKYILLLMIVMSLTACGKKEMDIKKYYFPYAGFMQSQVYIYADVNDSANLAYWFFTTTIENGDTILTTTIHDAYSKSKTVFRNKITTDGSILDKMLFIPNDSTNTVYTIKANETFKWKIKPGEKLYLTFGIYGVAASQEVVCERSIEPEKEKKEYNGHTYNTLVVKDLIFINQIMPNRTATEEQHKTAWFAEGIGLIEYITSHANGNETDFKLKKMITAKEWEILYAGTPDSSSTAPD